MISVSAIPYARAMSARFASTSSTSKPESISASPVDASSTRMSVAGSAPVRAGADSSWATRSSPFRARRSSRTHQDQDGEGDQNRAERDCSSRAGRWRRRSLRRRALGLGGIRAGPRCQGPEGVDGAAVGVRDVAPSPSVSPTASLPDSCRLAVGLRSPGVPLVSAGVGEAETVAVDLSVGVLVGISATGTAAPTTVSSAAAAQTNWPPRRKPAMVRRQWTTMCDYRPGSMAVDYYPEQVLQGCTVRPRPLPS